MNRFQLCARIVALLLLLGAFDALAITAQGTAITYQGQLTAGAVPPSNQTYQFTFTLYDASSGGTVVGTPIQKAVQVGNAGVFTTDLDFGQIFDGTQHWLEVKVGTTVGNQEVLGPRQKINTVPVAQYALKTPPPTFAEFYHSCSGQPCPTTVAEGETIPFPIAGPFSGSPILLLSEPGLLPPFSLTTQIQVTVSGTYEVSFEVNTSDAGNSLGLFLNLNFQSLAIPHAQVSQPTKTQIGRFLVVLNAFDKISLVNTGNFNLHLSADKDGATDANIIIKLLR